MVLVTTQLVAFWVPAAICLSIDLLFPGFSNRHKRQPERRQPSWQQINHCIKAVAVNEVVGIALQFIIRHFIGYDKSMFTVERQLLSLSTIASDFMYGMLAREVSFYYIHRAFHHPKVYAHIHKKNHKFTSPMAFAA